MTTDFTSLNLREELVQAITGLGYSEPTPIQTAIIPIMLSGKDVIGQAQTGTGKTAAFALPTLHNFTPQRHVQGLILAPTRELALQVSDSMTEYGKHLNVRVLAVYGGQPYGPQISKLNRGWILWWAPLAVCSTSLNATPLTSNTSALSCWTKPMKCLTWASSKMWKRSWVKLHLSARLLYFPLLCLRVSVLSQIASCGILNLSPLNGTPLTPWRSNSATTSSTNRIRPTPSRDSLRSNRSRAH